jgi:hypothetical protein
VALAFYFIFSSSFSPFRMLLLLGSTGSLVDPWIGGRVYKMMSIVHTLTPGTLQINVRQHQHRSAPQYYSCLKHFFCSLYEVYSESLFWCSCILINMNQFTMKTSCCYKINVLYAHTNVLGHYIDHLSPSFGMMCKGQPKPNVLDRWIVIPLISGRGYGTN